MATYASARPQQRSGNFFPSVTIRQDNPEHPLDDWISATAGMLTQRAELRPSEGRQETFSEWCFGDLTLTREVRPARQHTTGLNQSWQARRQGCFVLLCNDSEQGSTMLVVAPRASLAFAALATQGQHSGGAGQVLTLFLPRDACEGTEQEATAHILELDTAAGCGALLAGFMLHLAGQSGHIRGDRAKLLAVATRALVKACTAPAGGQVAPAPPSLTSGIVERARLVVQRHMASPDFGPAQLARLLAMSRSKLYRLLDGDGGVARFISRERLMQAWRGLTAPGDALSVHAIADQVGFRDHSTFSRAFRRAYGCTPTEAREGAMLARIDPAMPARIGKQASQRAKA